MRTTLFAGANMRLVVAKLRKIGRIRIFLVLKEEATGMTLKSLGYIGIRSSKTEDWSGFATDILVPRPGRKAKLVGEFLSPFVF